MTAVEAGAGLIGFGIGTLLWALVALGLFLSQPSGSLGIGCHHCAALHWTAGTVHLHETGIAWDWLTRQYHARITARRPEHRALWQDAYDAMDDTSRRRIILTPQVARYGLGRRGATDLPSENREPDLDTQSTREVPFRAEERQ